MKHSLDARDPRPRVKSVGIRGSEDVLLGHEYFARSKNISKKFRQRASNIIHKTKVHFARPRHIRRGMAKVLTEVKRSEFLAPVRPAFIEDAIVGVTSYQRAIWQWHALKPYLSKKEYRDIRRGLYPGSEFEGHAEDPYTGSTMMHLDENFRPAPGPAPVRSRHFIQGEVASRLRVPVKLSYKKAREIAEGLANGYDNAMFREVDLSRHYANVECKLLRVNSRASKWETACVPFFENYKSLGCYVLVLGIGVMIFKIRSA